jgi:hypothetical protein
MTAANKKIKNKNKTDVRLKKKRKKPDLVERVLLGAIPISSAIEDVDIATPEAEQFKIVRNFLTGQPELKARLEVKVKKLLQKEGKDRGKLNAKLAPLRLEILGQAELENWRRQAPKALSTLKREYSRYLSEVERLGANDITFGAAATARNVR